MKLSLTITVADCYLIGGDARDLLNILNEFFICGRTGFETGNLCLWMTPMKPGNFNANMSSDAKNIGIGDFFGEDRIFTNS